MTVETVHEFCRRILESSSIEDKLAPLGRGSPSGGDPVQAPLFIDRPARSGSLRLHSTSERLPKLGDLRDPSARAVCLERFGNHELMAVELFAWSLLAYPEAPADLRRGLVRVLEEEQGHVRLYLKRLEEVGSGLGQNPLSDYFWQQVPRIRASANGLVSFLCVMGLTLEQANLDFALLYRDAFRRQGDDLTAQLLNQIHCDEIGHVRLASTWLRRLTDPGVSDVEAYTAHIPFPLSAARAKGRNFDVASRRKAGLSEEMIEFVRAARPYPRTTAAPAGADRWGGVAVRSQIGGARVLYPNIGAEEGRAPRRGQREIEKMANLWSALFEMPDPGAPTRAMDSIPKSASPQESVLPLKSASPQEPVSPRTSASLRPTLAGRLAGLRGLIPWWSNPDAEVAATDHALTLTAASPQITREVHDKAFAHRIVQRNEPDALSRAIEVFDPEEILLSGFLQRVEAIVQVWPEPWRKRFVLKPRIGTTGRGWVRGLDGSIVDPNGIQRLAQRGGAILEPWLERVEDYSVQLWIHGDGRAEILGLTGQELSPRGMYLGNRGVAQGGRFLLDDARELAVGDALRKAARVVGDAAAAVGYRGACGIDAFTYRTDQGVRLRPVVELNARFTGGWVVLGWVERVLAASRVEGPVEWRFRWKGSLGEKRRFRDATFARNGRDLAGSSGPRGLPFCVCRLDTGALGKVSYTSDVGSATCVSGPGLEEERSAIAGPEIWFRPI